MSSEQGDTFSPHNLAVLGGLLFTALILGEAVFPRDSGDASGMMGVGTRDDIAMRLAPVITLASIEANSAGASAAGGADMTAKQMYDGACMACHATGAAGAPKVGDTAAWEGRMGSGVDGLLGSAISGKGAMPPKGGSTYTDEQLRTVVEFMLSESGM